MSSSSGGLRTFFQVFLTYGGGILSGVATICTSFGS